MSAVQLRDPLTGIQTNKRKFSKVDRRMDGRTPAPRSTPWLYALIPSTALILIFVFHLPLGFPLTAASVHPPSYTFSPWPSLLEPSTLSPPLAHCLDDTRISRISFRPPSSFHISNRSFRVNFLVISIVPRDHLAGIIYVYHSNRSIEENESVGQMNWCN